MPSAAASAASWLCASTRRSPASAPARTAPSVLAAAGANAPHDFPGLNLLPQLKTGQQIDRDTLFGESFAHDIADINQPQASLLYRWVIRGNHKLLLTYDGAPGKMKYPPQDGEPRLFNLKMDPKEKENLASQEPALAQELRSSCSRDGFDSGDLPVLPLHDAIEILVKENCPKT